MSEATEGAHATPDPNLPHSFVLTGGITGFETQPENLTARPGVATLGPNMARDIRGDGGWESGRPVIGTAKDNQNWRNRVPGAGQAPKESIGIRTRVGIRDSDGSHVINPNTGRPFGVGTSIIHNLSDIESDWEAKMILEPCFMCEHWLPSAYTTDEKILLLRNLVSEHGWTDEGVGKEIGDPRDYGLCEVDRLLSHRATSCPQNWSPKKTIARMFTGLGIGRKDSDR